MRWLVVAIACSGCSWAFMTRPPEVVVAPNHPVECTTSRAAPVLDTLCGGYFVLNGAVLAGGAGNYEQSARTGGIVISAALAALCIASAANGYVGAARCEHVKDQNALCMSGSMAACTALRPDWRPPPGGMSAPPADAGCTKDTDCKGDRVCDRGACVSPTPKPRGCQTDADCDRGVCFDGACHE